MQVNIDKRENLNRQIDEVDDTIVLSSDSDKTLSILLQDPRSPYSIPSPTSSTITASETSETKHSVYETDSSGIPILNEAIDTKPNQILVHTWFKEELSVKNLSRPRQKVLEVHLPLNKPELVKTFLKEYLKPNVKYFIYFEHETHRKQFAAAVIFLFKKNTVKILECTERVIYVEDENEQKEIVTKYHIGKTCHRGIKETLMRLKRTYYWPNMDLTVATTINSCTGCKTMKYDRKPLKPELQLTQTQTKPFQEIFIDVFSIDGKSYLTIVDAFSKLGQAIEINNKTTPEIIRALLKYFSMYGVPHKISADSGSKFNNVC